MIIKSIALTLASFITLVTSWINDKKPTSTPQTTPIEINRCNNATDSTSAPSNVCDKWQQDVAAKKEKSNNL